MPENISYYAGATWLVVIIQSTKNNIVIMVLSAELLWSKTFKPLKLIGFKIGLTSYIPIKCTMKSLMKSPSFSPRLF